MSTAEQFLKTLQKTERMPDAELAQYQRRLLERALRHAREHVPAYRQRLDPVFGPRGDFRFESWGELPILTRDELSRDGERFVVPDIPAHLHPIEWHATTGTTGDALRIAITQLALTVSACFAERRSLWHGLDTTQPLAMIRFISGAEADYPEGRTQKGWSFSNPGADLHTLSVRATIAEQVEWLQRRKPAYLQLYPSIANEIAVRIGEAGKGLGIAKVLSFGETVSEEQREAVKRSLGADIVDTYSTNDVGFIAIECPAGGGYHVMSEGIFFEIVDEAGHPVGEGTPGRVVVTPIYNSVMPLIRYALGDYAVSLAGPCPCGRALPRLQRVMGRSRHIFRYLDGTAKWPNLHSGDLLACVPLREFQVVQHTVTDIELRFARAPGRGDAVDLEALYALAREDLHPGVTIRVTEMPEIPRGAGGKFERYMSLVTPGAVHLSG